MKNILKAIGMFGAGVAFFMWGGFAYTVGYEECERHMTNARLHEDLLRKNTKLR